MTTNPSSLFRNSSYSLAILLLSVAVSASQIPHQANRLPPADTVRLKLALDAYDRGDAAQAEPVLKELALKYPHSYVANEALGSLYAEAGNMDGATVYLTKSIRITPSEPLAHANLGAVYLKQNRVADAVRELRTAARLGPNNAATQVSLGKAEMLAGKPAVAAVSFDLAASLSPADPELLYNLALALFNSMQSKRATEVLDRIPADSMTDEYHALAGDAAERTGEFKAALTHMQAAAQLNPSAPNLFALDVELLRHWTWDEALSVSRYSAQQFPQDARFPLASVIALFAKGDYQTAAVEASALLKANPDNNTYADLLGRSCGAAGEAAAPQCTQLETFAEAHPQNARIDVFAATAILERPVDHQDQATAQQLLAKAVLANPALPQAHYELAVLAQQNSNWEQSRTELEKAIALQPDYAEAHYRLSRAYAHLGRRDDAKRETELHQQYSDKQKDSLNARMQEVMLFLLKPS